MSKLPRRSLFWALTLLIAGVILAAHPQESSAQGYYGRACGGWSYPSWGYAVGMPGYYSDFRAQSYYTSPWLGYETPWYSPYGCGYGGLGGAGRYPWIWNRHANNVVRGYVVAGPAPSIKVLKNPFYKAGGEASPSDAPKTTAVPAASGNRLPIRVVSNPFVAAKK